MLVLLVAVVVEVVGEVASSYGRWRSRRLTLASW
jgi:hypothetical protein